MAVDKAEHIPELYLAILLFFSWVKGNTVEYFKYPAGFYKWISKTPYEKHINQPGDGYFEPKDYVAEITDKDGLKKRLNDYIRLFEKDKLKIADYFLYRKNIYECTKKWQEQYEDCGNPMIISFPQQTPKLEECATLFSLYIKKQPLVKLVDIIPDNEYDYEKMIFKVKFSIPPKEIYERYKSQNPLNDNDIVIDEKSGIVRCGKHKAKFSTTSKEFKLICLIKENLGKAIPIDEVRSALRYSNVTKDHYTLDCIRSVVKEIEKKFLPAEPFETHVTKKYMSITLKK
ncbi:MAG: hypothetical protein FWG57_02565 [Endomicrobia bacterium]|nr:hypothetical protein [Endomicrobiia bacterium]